MTKVILNKKTVLSLLKKKLNDEELEEKATDLGTPIEELNHESFVIEVLPNRPDLLSENGFSRALNSFLGFNLGLKEYKINNSNETVIIENSVKDVRPFTACAIVKDLNLDNEKIKEIMQLQEKLHLTFGRNRKKLAIGIYPFEKIYTPIRYLALNPNKIKFKPLGSNILMNAEEILSKTETGKTYAHLLDDKDKYPLFVDNKNNILSMPPIINSQDVGEVTLKTKDVFIECSGFDFNVLNKCLNIIVTSLNEMGGKIYSIKLKYGKKIFITPNLKPFEIKLNINNVNKLLGLNLKENEIKKFLERMGFNYNNKKVLVPCYRADIMHENDLIEDIAIAYGYENFTPELPNIFTIWEEDKFEYFKNKISEFLIGLNLLEVNNYNISNEINENKKMMLDNKLILIENSLNIDYNCMRYNLIPSLLNNLKNNKHNEYPQRMFETGKTFTKGKNETNINEKDKLGIVLCDNKVSFTEIKQILDSLFLNLKINYSIEEYKHPNFIEGRCGKILFNNKEIGFIGEINPQILENFELELPVAALELDLNELFQENK